MNYCFLNPLFFLNDTHNKPVNNLNPSAERSSMFIIREKSQEEKNAIKIPIRDKCKMCVKFTSLV